MGGSPATGLPHSPFQHTRSRSGPFPDNGDVSSVVSSRPPLPRSSTQYALGMFRVYTPPGGKPSPIQLAFSRMSSASPHGRKPRNTSPSPRVLEILCLITLLRFYSLMARLSPMARPDGEFTSPSRAHRRPAQYGAQSPLPLQVATG